MPTTNRRGLTATFAAFVVYIPLAALASACTHVAATPSLADEEQRLLPEIVRQQEARVQEATRAADTAHDAARSLRLRQRMLLEHGRDDLAMALEQDAVAKEAEEANLRQKLRNEQDTLLAYREHAARVGLGGSWAATPPAGHGFAPGR